MPKIKLPKYYSEFEIQATIYSKLKDHGINIRGEVRGAVKKDGVKQGSRFDLVIFNQDDAAILVIEVKKNKQAMNNRSRKNQLVRYMTFGAPVIWITGMIMAETFIKEFIENPTATILTTYNNNQLFNEQRQTSYSLKQQDIEKVIPNIHIEDYRYTKFALYSKTAQWYNLTNQVIKLANSKCVYCCSTINLIARHLHHNSYGREKLADLECLCLACNKTQPWKKPRSKFKHRRKNK